MNGQVVMHSTWWKLVTWQSKHTSYHVKILVFCHVQTTGLPPFRLKYPKNQNSVDGEGENTTKIGIWLCENRGRSSIAPASRQCLLKINVTTTLVDWPYEYSVGCPVLHSSTSYFIEVHDRHSSVRLSQTSHGWCHCRWNNPNSACDSKRIL